LKLNLHYINTLLFNLVTKDVNTLRFLVQNSLLLTLRSVVAGEARTHTGLVITDSTARAITALVLAIPAHNIVVGGAFTERTVRPAKPNVTDASLLLQSIPRSLVRLAGFRCKLLGSNTNSAARAIVRADSAFARVTFVVIKALAKTSLAVTLPLVRAFSTFVTTVVGGSNGYPSFTHWASTQGAISPGPCSIRVVGSDIGRTRIRTADGTCCGVVALFGVAGAFIIQAAGTMARATIGAICLGEAEGG
jgi:hypothetical protein